MSDNGTGERCAALTRAGSQCKRRVRPGSAYCGIHQPAASQATAEKILVAEEIPIEEELSEKELRRRLMSELDGLIARLQALAPGDNLPPFSPRALLDLLEKNADRLPAGVRVGILKRLRQAVNEDLLDVETWKGIWYMLNHTLSYQGDILKRRFTGDYQTDEWGLDWEFLEAVRPFLDFLYKLYWRVQTTGVENIPDYDRALLVANRSGQLPWDSAMIMTAVLNEHPAQRLVRNLYPAWVPTIPFLSAVFVKTGQALATIDNGVRLLGQDELVAVYPEGDQGASKLFKNRYRLARFQSSDFVRMALQTQAPLIPVSVVGAEETSITLARSSTLAQLAGLPYFPISLTFPWLGPAGLIPLPTRWYIDVGQPMPTGEYGPDDAEDLVLLSRLADQLRDAVQEMVNTRLAERRSIFT
ncbi:MAG: acyltransferase family protein [Chloroflexi bacterium]|nr:acyltransferase family protein [Chloroflexota bacterium]MCI0575701.1 acyltransferase family protein [Chloroflexota bacterium]MCI0648043.1 acyltransferase family protein [Chloroflexota bacterium]MCI0726471.1 acyltransferase family protein [Chloroflexota bacterium]